MYKLKFKKFIAMSTSELLITLSIIGIIAAITIPAINQNMNDNQFKTMLKKTYKNLNDAFSSAYEAAAVIEGTNYSLSSADSIPGVYNAVSKYLSVSKFCGNNLTKLTGDCFAEAKAKNKTAAPLFSSITGKNSVFVLNDGVSVGMTYEAKNNMLARYGINPANRSDAGYCIITVDINGKKGPNAVGKDVHAFVYTSQDGLLPAGADDDGANCKGSTNYNYGCSATLLGDL